MLNANVEVQMSYFVFSVGVNLTICFQILRKMLYIFKTFFFINRWELVDFDG